MLLVGIKSKHKTSGTIIHALRLGQEIKRCFFAAVLAVDVSGPIPHIHGMQLASTAMFGCCGHGSLVQLPELYWRSQTKIYTCCFVFSDLLQLCQTFKENQTQFFSLSLPPSGLYPGGESNH